MHIFLVLLAGKLPHMPYHRLKIAAGSIGTLLVGTGFIIVCECTQGDF